MVKALQNGGRARFEGPYRSADLSREPVGFDSAYDRRYAIRLDSRLRRTGRVFCRRRSALPSPRCAGAVRIARTSAANARGPGTQRSVSRARRSQGPQGDRPLLLRRQRREHASPGARRHRSQRHEDSRLRRRDARGAHEEFRGNGRPDAARSSDARTAAGRDRRNGFRHHHNDRLEILRYGEVLRADKHVDSGGGRCGVQRMVSDPAGRLAAHRR